MPTSDVWRGQSYRVARYANGTMYWSKKTGAQAVRGHFLTAYRTYGGPTGPLLLPTGPRKRSRNLPHGGLRQNFSGGALYLRAGGSQVFALWGPVQARYRKLGEARSACKYPASSMKPVHNGMVATFQNGTIRVTGRGRLFVHCGS
jgi:uncharacterized protein with LGFP repeats